MQVPQTPVELIVGYLGWAHKNISNNVDAIPDDKLDWKPAPDSKSVLEIINHATDTVNTFTSGIKETEPPTIPPATDKASAKNRLTQVVQTHLATIQALTPDEMQKIVKLPVGEFPKGFVAGLPVVELINHHGQITYIQTLLGDNESHLSVA